MGQPRAEPGRSRARGGVGLENTRFSGEGSSQRLRRQRRASAVPIDFGSHPARLGFRNYSRGGGFPCERVLWRLTRRAPPLLARFVDRYGEVGQYSLAKIVGLWAAAALPMGFLAWVCVPLLRDQLGGRDPFIESLLICLNVGLLWILALTLILLRHEQGRLESSRVIDGLWLRSPRSPNTGKVGGTVWLWAIRSSYSPARSIACRSTQTARCRGTCPSFLRTIRPVLRTSSTALGAGSRCSCW